MGSCATGPSSSTTGLNTSRQKMYIRSELEGWSECIFFFSIGNTTRFGLNETLWQETLCGWHKTQDIVLL